MIQESAPLYGGQLSRRVTIRDLKMAKQRSERWPMLASYDMYTAEVFDEAGIPVLLVGDSAANNVYGHADTVPVTVDELIPLARAVVRSTRRRLLSATCRSVRTGRARASAGDGDPVMKEPVSRQSSSKAELPLRLRYAESSMPASRSWGMSASLRERQHASG